MMDKLRPFLPAVILGAFVVAAAAIWWPHSSDLADVKASQSQDISARLDEGEARLAGLVEVTNARPVFHASRRPVVAPEAPKAPEPILQLLGIISEDNAKVLAFVKISNSPALYRIGKGEALEKWRILDIGKEEILVSKEDGPPYALRIGE